MGSRRIFVPKGLLTLDDNQLAAKLIFSDGDALAALIERHGGAVFRIARGIVGDNAEAEELVQQVFLEVYRNIAGFNLQKGSFKAWLLRRAFSRAVDWRKHLQAQRFYLWDEIDEAVATEQMDTLLDLSTQEQGYLIEQLLARLPERECSVVKLKYFTGLTVREIAEKTQEPLSSVASVLYRGLRTMRALLRERRQGTQTEDGEIKGEDELIV